MSDEARRNVLLALLVVLVLVAGWRGLPLLLSDAGPGRRAGGSGLVGGAAGPEVAELDVDELVAEPRGFEAGRNPFSYYTPPPPPPPEPTGPTPEELAAQRAREAAERAAREEERQEQEPAEPPAPTPPEFQLTFLGSFGPESRRIAVFTDGETVYNAVVGDVIEDKFRVADIGFESVTITYVGFPETPGTRVGIGG